MKEPFFTEKENMPEEKSLKTAFGKNYSFFDEIVQLTLPLNQEWKFYGSKYGWSLKMFDKKKAVCYLTPYKDVCLFGMAIREKEKDLVLESKVSKKVREKLASEKKIMEGYPVSFLLNSKTAINDITKILKILDAERKLKLFE